MTSGTTSSQQQPDYACNLSALTPAQRVQHGEVTEQLRQMVRGRTDLPAGYAYEFVPQAEALALLAQFIQHERLCCPFFAFTLHVEHDAGPIRLEITGPAGIQPFIRAELNW